MSKIQLLNIDNMEFMANVPDKFYDLCIADPPYGIGDKKLTTGGTWSVKWKNTALWDIAPNKAYFDELFRISKNQIIWGGNYFELPPNRCFLIWDKVAKMGSMADCEYAWASFDSNAKVFRHVRNTSETRIHITQKPIKLYEWILRNYAKEGDKIFDPNFGSASSAIAAHNLGFEYVGLEIDTEYFEKAQKRFNIHASQSKLILTQ